MSFLDAKTDFAFKKVFGSEQTTNILRSFLNATLYTGSPQHITDLTIAHAMQLAPSEFAIKAQLALASKLYEMGQISSHAAAQLAGLTRATFLFTLADYNTSFINTKLQDLNDDIHALA